MELKICIAILSFHLVKTHYVSNKVLQQEYDKREINHPMKKNVIFTFKCEDLLQLAYINSSPNRIFSKLLRDERSR